MGFKSTREIYCYLWAFVISARGDLGELLGMKKVLIFSFSIKLQSSFQNTAHYNLQKDCILHTQIYTLETELNIYI